MEWVPREDSRSVPIPARSPARQCPSIERTQPTRGRLGALEILLSYWIVSVMKLDLTEA